MKKLTLLLIILLLTSACRELADNSSSSENSQSKQSNKGSAAKSQESGRGPSDHNEATLVYRAVQSVLSGDSNPSYQQSVELLKETISAKELRNNRNKRKDPNLLEDRYPKNKQLTIDGGQKAYWTAYDRLHFAARHLIDYFDSSDIKGKNSWWPAGTTQEQLDQYLAATLAKYGNRIKLPREGQSGPGFKYYDFDLPGQNGFEVSVGITSEGRVTSFFPRSGPNVMSLSEDDVRTLLTAVRGN